MMYIKTASENTSKHQSKIKDSRIHKISQPVPARASEVVFGSCADEEGLSALIKKIHILKKIKSVSDETQGYLKPIG